MFESFLGATRGHRFSVFVLVLCLAFLVLFQNCNQSLNKEIGREEASSIVDLGRGDGDHHPPPLPSGEKVGVSFEALLSDRHYTLALFNDVFGPTAESVEGTGLARNAIEFGSPCSIYENFNVADARGNPVAADPNNNICTVNPSAAVLGASVVPRPTVIRQALILKACTNLVLNSTTLSHALHLISPTEALPQPTEANMRTLFRLFYPQSATAPAEVIQALQAMVDPGSLAAESWQAPIYSVCSSSYWQVL